MAIVFAPDSVTEKIVDEVEKLSDEQRHTLLLKLRRKELKDLAHALDKGTKPNRITTAEIVKRVKQSRQK
jgi:hypothetical protein